MIYLVQDHHSAHLCNLLPNILITIAHNWLEILSKLFSIFVIFKKCNIYISLRNFELIISWDQN